MRILFGLVDLHDFTSDTHIATIRVGIFKNLYRHCFHGCFGRMTSVLNCTLSTAQNVRMAIDNTDQQEINFIVSILIATMESN